MSGHLPPLRAICIGILLWAAFTSASKGQVVPPLPGLERPVVDDFEVVDRIERVGGGLIREGKAVPLKKLRAQLARRQKCQLSLPSEVPEASLGAQEIYAKRSRAVVVVGMLGKSRKKKGTYEVSGCSGFALLADGIFVTNYHVVDDPKSEGMVVMTRDGTVTGVTEILAADKLADIAICKAAGATFAETIPLASEVPVPGMPVSVISHPNHNFYTLTTGMVSRVFVAEMESGRTAQVAITADFGIGSSGGPVMDQRGAAVAMVASTTSLYWQDEKGKDTDLQMVFKHCVPAVSILRLIEEPAPTVIQPSEAEKRAEAAAR